MDPQDLPSHVAFPAAAAAPCPACGGSDTHSFYRLQGIPVHSCVLLEDADRAKAFPTGDLELAACAHCGFIFNQLFDPARIDYSEDYVETQGCSGTFRSFLEGTIQGLLKGRECANQLMVEIGCGRGDFLEQLCRAADARGIGIDPSSTAGRVDLRAGRGLSFLQESYSKKHLALDARAIFCRHTLEHLPKVQDLVALVFKHLESRSDNWTFFEVPDSLRILKEGAFWDVYYEHCSYFSEASLGRIFESAGFVIKDLDLVYGRQYLHLLAQPGTCAADQACKDPAQMLQAVQIFRGTCCATIARWHKLLHGHPPGTVALWGSGSKATGFLTTVGNHDRIDCVVDINPDKHGRFVAGTGHEIVAPAALKGRPIRTLIIMNPIYTDEITTDVQALGLNPQVLTL
ncbi:MAG: methyltransferase domain-containing protein [bacterium]|nr:methyltransferase domain-containing protein [bacterium]